MLLQIGIRAPDGSDPLALLGATHRRHLSRLRALSFAGAHLLDPSADKRQQAIENLGDALTFFSRASDDPFRDEEELLFPRLLSSAASDGELVLACQSLGGDRKRAAELHTEVREHGTALAQGTVTAQIARAFAIAVQALEELYRGHLERLEAQVFPRARALLQELDSQALATTMLETTLATVLPEEPSTEPVGALQS